MSLRSVSVSGGADEDSWGMRADSASTISGVTEVTSVTTTPSLGGSDWLGPVTETAV